MDFIVSNRPKLPRNHYGWVNTGNGNSTNIKGGSGLDSKTLNSLYDLIDWFYRDSSGNIHARYDFCGDGEVAAYSMGPGGNIQGYNTDWIDSSYLYILDLIDQLDLDISIDGSIDLTSYAKRDWVENNFAKRDWVQGNFPDNGSVNDNYLKKSAFDSSFNTLSNYISTLNSSINQIEKWWWIDGSNINTSYNVISYGNVAAYGAGDGGSIDGYPREHIDTSYEYIIDLINNIDIDISGGDIDLSNYPTNSSVWKHYVHDVSVRLLDSSLQNINISIGEISTRLSNISTRLGQSDSSINEIEKWWWVDDSSNIHTIYNIIGHGNVAAYGIGDGGSIDGYPRQHIDTSYAYLIDLIDSIDIDVSGGDIDLSGYVTKNFLELNYPTNSSVWKSYVHNASLNNLDSSLQNINLSIGEISTRLSDVSSKLDGLDTSVQALDTSVQALSSWWWLDSDGNLNTSLNVIGHQQISCYGLGEEGEINLLDFAKWTDISSNYYTRNYIDTSYNVLNTRINASYNHVLDLIDNISINIDGDTADLSIFVRKTEFERHKTDVCNGITEVSTRLNDLSIFVDNMNLNVYNNSTGLKDVSADLHDWLYYEPSTNTLHSRYPFVGDFAISCYGLGEEGSEIDLAGYAKWVDISTNYYTKSFIDSSYRTLDNKINNIDITGQLSNYATKSWVNSSLSKYATQTWVNTSLGKYVKKTDFNSSFNELKGDINNANTSIGEVSARLKSTDASVLDLSTRIKNVSSNVNDVSLKLNDWLYYEPSTNTLHSRYPFVGDSAISAYGLGEEGSGIDLAGYAKWVDISTNYYIKSYINTSYMELNNKINNIDITGQLSNYATKSWVNSSLSKYATQTWVNTSLGKYVKKTDFDSSYNTLSDRIANVSQGVNNANVSIGDVSTRLKNLTTQVDKHDASIKQGFNNLKSTDASVLDLSTRIKNVSSNVLDVSSKLNDWFYKDSSGVHCRYDFIGQYAISCYGQGDSGSELNLDGYAKWVDISTNYYTKSFIDSSYRTLDNKINNIDITSQLSNYATKTWVNTSLGKYATQTWVNTSLGKYATQTWVNTSLGKYVLTTTYNTAINRISQLESDLNVISENYVNVSTWNADKNRQNTSINLICSNIDKINTSIGSLNTSVNNVEKWFTLQNGRLVTTYPLISQQEICAYGLGESGDTVIDMTDYVSNASMNDYWIPTLDSRYLRADSNVNIGNHLLNVGGNTSTGSLFVRNQANMNSKLAVKGETSIDSSLYVAKNVSVGQQLQVTGNTHIGNILNVGGNTSTAALYVRNAATLNGTLSVTGKTTLGNVSIGYLSATGAVTVAGKTTLKNVSLGALSTTGNVSIGGGKMSVETKNPVFRLGKVNDTDSSILNASLYFGTQARGYINVSTLKDGTDLVDDMTIAAGRNIDLKCENINLVAPTSVDGGLNVNGLITGSGNMKLNSQTTRLTLGADSPGTGFNSSIVFGNSTQGYIRSYRSGSTKVMSINAGDVLTLSGGTKVQVDTVLVMDGDVSFFDRGSILGAGEIYCEDLIYDSDQRLKKNIKPLEYKDKGGLNPVEFDMVKTSRHSIGFVAQEVAEKYPQVVHENKDGYLSLDYPKITAILSAQVNYLEDKITRLEKILNEKGLI